MDLFIYTGNHGKQDGIEDYLTVFKNVFGSRGFQVIASSTLRPNSTNIIIDEFTSFIENRRIAKFRKNNPNNRCIFVLTEFAESKFGVETLNHFGGLLDAAIIALVNVYWRLSREDFDSVRIRDFAALLMYCPVLATYFLLVFTKYIALRLFRKKVLNPVGDFLRRHHRLIYFHMRYLGLKAHLKYADAIISSHELIMPGYDEDLGVDGQKLKFLGVIYPEFNKQHVLESVNIDKELYLEITGSITKYRQKKIQQLNFQINNLGLNNVFGTCKAWSFKKLASGKQRKRAAYSLHPPQTRNWPYCSPTRIYRALEVDHNLPVLTKNFAQNPIEDVCFLLKDKRSLEKLVEMFFNREAMLDFVGPRIETYNKIVKQRNDALANSLKTIGSNRC